MYGSLRNFNENTYSLGGSYLQKMWDVFRCPIISGLTARRIAPCSMLFPAYNNSIVNVTVGKYIAQSHEEM